MVLHQKAAKLTVIEVRDMEIANEFVFGEVDREAAILDFLQQEGVSHDGLFGGCERKERDDRSGVTD